MNKPVIYVDPSRESFETELKKNFLKNLQELNISIGGFIIKHAFNDRLKGIDICNTLFNQDKVYISEKCKNLLQQMSNYVWDKIRHHSSRTSLMQSDFLMLKFL